MLKGLSQERACPKHALYALYGQDGRAKCCTIKRLCRLQPISVSGQDGHATIKRKSATARHPARRRVRWRSQYLQSYLPYDVPLDTMCAPQLPHLILLRNFLMRLFSSLSSRNLSATVERGRGARGTCGPTDPEPFFWLRARDCRLLHRFHGFSGVVAAGRTWDKEPR